MALDGELVAIDRGYARFDEFPTPRLRAAGMLLDHDKLIAERGTAAWIWGARSCPPVPHEFCTAQEARIAHRSQPHVIIREVVLQPSEVVRVGGVQVTTPLRTTADLARFTDRWTPRDETTVITLMRECNLSLETLTVELSRHKLPHKRRAMERVLQAWSVLSQS